jgi:hypothetical protein
VPGAFGLFCSLAPSNCAAVESLGLVYYTPPADWYTQLLDAPSLFTLLAAADKSISNSSAPAVVSGISDISISSRTTVCNRTRPCTATLTTPLVGFNSSSGSSQAEACALFQMGAQGRVVAREVVPAVVSTSVNAGQTTVVASCEIQQLGAYVVVGYSRAMPVARLPTPLANDTMKPTIASGTASGGGAVDVGLAVGVAVAAAVVAGGLVIGGIVLLRRRARQRVVLAPGAPIDPVVEGSRQRASLQVAQG